MLNCKIKRPLQTFYMCLAHDREVYVNFRLCRAFKMLVGDVFSAFIPVEYIL